MQRRTIFIVVLLATLSLAGIVFGQVFWVKKAYNFQEKQFNDRTVVALSAVVTRILEINKDSAITEPVQQKSNNFFVANINETPPPFLLETLLREEFEKSNLTEDFEYGIYDCFSDSIVFGSRVQFASTQVNRQPMSIEMQEAFTPDGHYFGVRFPSKTTIILKQLDFWIYSSFAILLITIFFTYTIMVILKQKRLSEVKTDFINNMTHELKTPISTIQLSADALVSQDMTAQPEKLKQYATIIRNENQRLKTQVDKVLQIATLTPEKVNLKLEQIDVHEVIEKAVESFRLRVEDQGGTIHTSLLAGEHHILGDRVHITNVIYNLLDNALKYTQKIPAVRIGTTITGNRLHLSVADNGIGIEPRHLKMIFDKFYRVPTGNLHDVKGFGLGLYYVKTIVRAHKGDIRVTSKPGEGTVFTLIFHTIHE